MRGQYAHPGVDADRLFRQGATNAEVMRAYPTLTADHLDLVRKYYETHRTEIDRDIREQDAEETPARG